MKRTIDWPNHIVSFVIVLVSILLAFQLDRCSADRREDEIVRNHLAEIEQETRFNLANIEPAMAHMRTNGRSLDTLLNQIINSDDTRAINQRMMNLLDIRPLYLKTTAYAALESSGDVRFIDDFDVKRNLTTLYEYHELTDVRTQLLMDIYNDDYFEYIQQELDLHRARPQPIEKYRERRFVNGISSYRYFINVCLRDYQATAARMQRYLDGEDVAGR